MLLPTKILLVSMILIAAYYDLRWRRIPNWLTLPLWLIGLALNAVIDPQGAAGGQGGIDHWRGFLFGLLGFGAAMLIYFPLYLLRGMGAGDVKLMAAIGALVGWRAWLGILFFSALLGGLAGLILVLSKGRGRTTLFNLAYIISDLIHFRAPHAHRDDLDVTKAGAFGLPHGAVVGLGVFAFLGAQAVWG